jgi:hypothetical protein
MAAGSLPPIVFQVDRAWVAARPTKIKKQKLPRRPAFAGWQRRYRWIFYVF